MEVLAALVVNPGLDEAGVVELLEVVDDGFRADADVLGDLRDVAGLACEQLEDASAVLVAEQIQQCP